MTEFDKGYYKQLMDGLEVSEVSYRYIKKASDIFRFDSFYYAKEFLNDEHLIEKRNNHLLRDLAGSLKSFGAYSLNNYVEYQKSGVPFIRGVNMKNGLIDFDNILYITEEANKLLYKSEVMPETLLLSMSGTIGDVAIALPEWRYPVNSNQDIAKIMINKNITSPYYVYAFLRSKYGQNYLKREARGSVQQHVFLSQMEMFRIPVFSEKGTFYIEKIVKKGLLCYKESKKIMKEAEELLIETLGLNSFAPQTERYSVKTFKMSFEDAERLDAEYFQAEYDNYDNLLKQYHNGYGLIGDICTIKDKNYNPDHKTEYSYIELSDVGQQGDISDCSKIYGINLPTRARRKVYAGDVIFSSVEGSLSKCALITPDCDGYLCTNGFYVVSCDSINPETLMMLFKSKPIQALLKKGCSGTILSAIGKDELLKIPLPIIESIIQEKIRCLVTESNLARRHGKELLDKAIGLVETAIEQGEDVAFEYANNI